LSQEERAPWRSLHEEEVKRYERDVVHYRETRVINALSLLGPQREDPRSPVEPMSAFFYWLLAHHEEYLAQPRALPEAAYRDWNALSEEERAPSVQRLEEEKKRYEREMAHYLANREA